MTIAELEERDYRFEQDGWTPREELDEWTYYVVDGPSYIRVNGATVLNNVRWPSVPGPLVAATLDDAYERLYWILRAAMLEQPSRYGPGSIVTGVIVDGEDETEVDVKL